MLHDFPGQLVGQNTLSIGCGKQFGGRTLPRFNAINKICHFPKVVWHSLCYNLLGAFFLVQYPNAVFLVQTQCFVIHVTPGHQDADRLAHAFALHDPACIGRTHQTVESRNLLERVVGCLFAQMVDQQNTDIILVCQCLQSADSL